MVSDGFYLSDSLHQSLWHLVQQKPCSFNLGLGPRNLLRYAGVGFSPPSVLSPVLWPRNGWLAQMQPETKIYRCFKPHLGLPFGNLQDKGLSLGLIMVDLHHYFMGWSTQTWIQPLSSCEISALDISWSLKFFPSTPEKNNTFCFARETHKHSLSRFFTDPSNCLGGVTLH